MGGFTLRRADKLRDLCVTPDALCDPKNPNKVNMDVVRIVKNLPCAECVASDPAALKNLIALEELTPLLATLDGGDKVLAPLAKHACTKESANNRLKTAILDRSELSPLVHKNNRLVRAYMGWALHNAVDSASFRNDTRLLAELATESTFLSAACTFPMNLAYNKLIKANPGFANELMLCLEIIDDMEVVKKMACSDGTSVLQKLAELLPDRMADLVFDSATVDDLYAMSDDEHGTHFVQKLLVCEPGRTAEPRVRALMHGLIPRLLTSKHGRFVLISKDCNLTMMTPELYQFTEQKILAALPEESEAKRFELLGDARVSPFLLDVAKFCLIHANDDHDRLHRLLSGDHWSPETRGKRRHLITQNGVEVLMAALQNFSWGPHHSRRLDANLPLVVPHEFGHRVVVAALNHLPDYDALCIKESLRVAAVAPTGKGASAAVAAVNHAVLKRFNC